jgi:hypothetical protein
LRENKDAGLWAAEPDLAGRDEPLVCVGGRHADVDDRDVRSLARDEALQLDCVAGLATNLDSRVALFVTDKQKGESTMSGSVDSRSGPSPPARWPAPLKRNAGRTQVKGLFDRHTAPAHGCRPEAACRSSRRLRHSQ